MPGVSTGRAEARLRSYIAEKNMTPNNDQNAINEAEWQNSNNWSTIYFSKRDTRSSVPKKNPKHGWTINFGHPKGARWIYYLLLLFFALGFIIGLGLGIGIGPFQ